MNSKIINPSQYKKTTKEKRQKKAKYTERKIRRGKTNINSESLSFINIRTSNESKKKRAAGALTAIFFMVIISITSAAILSIEDNPIINVFSNDNNESKINRDINFNIACLNFNYDKNIVYNELKNLSYPSILTFDKEYNITFNLAESVIKNDDLTYTVRFKDKDVNSIAKKEIERIIGNVNNIYNNIFVKISSMEILDKYNLKINLAVPYDYFIYYLDFPLIGCKDSYKNSLYTESTNTQNPVISFNGNSKDVISHIYISNYTNNFDIIDGFKNKQIDMFLTTNEDNMKLLGRYDYNIKKYRDGETYFLFGNPASELFKLEEVRKAIAYSIDRGALAKSVSTSFAEVIDIPYIYSTIDYKYDVFAAANMLTANSWTKYSGVYVKSGTGVKLELRLLVNSDDAVKCSLADTIKQMLESVGIKLNVEKLDNSSIAKRVEEGTYDIVLTKLYIGRTPDISYIYDYINIDEDITSAINNLKNANTSTIADNVKSLKKLISEKVACIGLVAKNTNVITQKYISGIDSISYMNIFENIHNIGISNE